MRTALFTSIILAVLASSAGAQESKAANIFCKEGEFWFPDKNVCLLTGGPPGAIDNKGHKCPAEWYWADAQAACVPFYASSPRPICTEGSGYERALCAIRCKTPGVKVFFENRNQCEPSGGPAGFLPTLKGKNTCAEGPDWEWNDEFKTCLPKNLKDRTPIIQSCNPGSEFDPITKTCKPTLKPTPVCSQNTKWNPLTQRCEPANRPACPPGLVWNATERRCVPNSAPGPQPSQHISRRANPKNRSEHTFCPSSFKACPVPGHLETDECIDPENDATSCGGCGSLDPKYDCTRIAGASVFGATCQEGKCHVHSCRKGFELNIDKTGCSKIYW